MKRRSNLLVFILLAAVLAGCGSGNEKVIPTSSLWTWIAGATTTGQAGIYGIKGTGTALTRPGARSGAVSWSDAAGNLWLFGGNGVDGGGATGLLNDLWRWNGTNWTWIAGDLTTGQMGFYGIKGTAAAANKPGARSGAVSWSDAAGNLWLFGGGGVDGGGAAGLLNDLWRFH